MNINATLVTINSDCPDEGAKALQYSSKHIDFNDVVMITDTDKEYDGVRKIKVDPITSVKQYNDFMLNLIDYIDDNVLVVQSDGFIVNHLSWEKEWEQYDYIGAPWSNDERWIQDQSPDRRDTIREAVSKNRIGNGGFSWRSRKFLEYSRQFVDCGIYGEDIFLTAINYDKAIEYGIRFPSLKTAFRFSYENRCPEMGHDYRDVIPFDVSKHFGFHACNWTNQKQLLNLKNDI